MGKQLRRAVIEVGFIIFLFYANLLMGEFEQSGIGTRKGWMPALADVMTGSNFAIAIIAGILGYTFFEFLRKRL